MPELIPVDHDPFNDPPTNLIPVDHDPFASLGAQPKEGQTVAPQNVQTDIASLPPKVAGTVGDMLGLTDAAKALRGEMTPEEAEKFALYAAAGLVTPEMRAARAAMNAAEKVAPELTSAVGHVLPMDEESRMARAAQQGFTIDAFHGTGSPEFEAFDPSKVRDNIQYGGNFYFTPEAEFANKHTGKWSGDTPRVMPVKLNIQNPFRMDQPVTAEQAAAVLNAAGRKEQAQKMIEGGPLKYWTGSTLFYHGLGQDTPAAIKAQAIKDAGYDAIIGDPHQEIVGTPGRPHIMVFDPSQIRSRFDSFDPANIGSSRLIHDVPPAVPEPQGIRAYHGSPYDFEKFDISKIGTGEGAQVYGHGLYFAENPATAKAYRDTLAPLVNPQPAEEQIAADAIERFGSRERAIQELQDVVKRREAGEQPPKNSGTYFPYHDEASMAVDLLKSDWQPKTPGKMYEVNINADPEHFLDWDKPLSAQSEHVKQAIAKVDSSLPVNPPSITQIKDPTIRNVIRAALQQNEGRASDLELMIDNDGRLYKTVTDHAKRNGVDLEAKDMRASDYVYQQAKPFIDALAASQNTTGEMVHRVLGSKGADVMAQGPAAARLHEAGIPGIKYLDQGSRGAGEGTKNYVVFNDKLVDIIKKYGLAGLVAGGAAHYQTTPVDHNPFE